VTEGLNPEAISPEEDFTSLSEEEEGEIKNYERRRKLNRMKKELQRKARRLTHLRRSGGCCCHCHRRMSLRGHLMRKILKMLTKIYRTRPYSGSRLVFKFFAKSLFIAVNASFRWLNNVSCLFLSLLLITRGVPV
jgi:hypothetical protein